jgi:hypothetical protein
MMQKKNRNCFNFSRDKPLQPHYPVKLEASGRYGTVGSVKIEMNLIFYFLKMVSIEIIIGKLTFRLVDFNTLNHNNHYVIRTVGGMHSCYVAGRFLEKVFTRTPRFIQTNDGSGYFQPSGARFFIRDIYGEKRGLRTFNTMDYYYEFVPKKEAAQQAMEKRALQMILRNIIGDNLFTYE